MKGFIIFMAGAAVGGLAAALVTSKILKKKYKKISDEKMKSMEEYVDFLWKKDEAGELAENLKYVAKDGENQVSTANDQVEKESSREKAVAKKAADYLDYTKFYTKVEKAEEEHPLDDNEEDEQRMKELHERINREANIKQKPRIIKASEYDDPDYEHHDKVTLYYYVEDETLTTEDNEIIDDPVAYVGDAITKYGFNTNDEQAIYVRNVSRGTDYEIAKVFGAYEE